MRTSLIGCLVATCAVVACSGNPAAPSAASAGPATWVLSGQSNAVGLRAPLTVFATITGVQQNTTAIAAWDDGQPLWTALARDLAAPHQAFVWWQGESDAADPAGYLVKLSMFLDRVRAFGSVRIVLCSANHAASLDGLRRVQQLYVDTHPGMLMVRTDDLPVPGPGEFDVPTQSVLPAFLVPDTSPHVTAGGYRLVAERVAHLLR